MPIKSFVLHEPLSSSDINTYCYNNGLKYVTHQIAPGNFSVSNCFTSEFDAYRIVFNRIFSYDPFVIPTATMNLMTGTSTIYAGAAYYSAGVATTPGAAVVTKNDNGATGWNMTRTSQNGLRNSGGVIDILVRSTSSQPSYSAMMVDASGTTNIRAWSQSGFINNNAVYTGFTLTHPTINLYGEVYVYGYRKA